MEISKIQFIENRQKLYTPSWEKRNQKSLIQIFQPAIQDCFIKSKSNTNITDGINTNPAKINFLGKVPYINYDFEKKYTRGFFVKLMREGIPDAYSDIERLISREEYDSHRAMETFSKKSSIAIKHLKKYRNSMFPVEKEVFTILEKASKKHPNLNLQELLKLKYPQAEQTLINQQGEVLNKINLMIRTLPKKDFQAMRKVIKGAFDRIFSQELTPEERFGRKTFLAALREVDIEDKNFKAKIYKIAETLPQSSDSVNAFIVKYSHPYKLRYDYNKQQLVRQPRDSQEIGERLLEPSLGTDDHIHAQKEFKKEQAARLKGDKQAAQMSTLRVTTLTSSKANSEKSDMPIDKYIETSKYNIPERIQHQIDRYTFICEKWLKQGKFEDANLLADYIIELKGEYARRSKILHINTTEIEKLIPQVKAAVTRSRNKNKEKIYRKQKHSDNASNSHKERYTDASGRVVENRKVQKHSSRFHR